MKPLVYLETTIPSYYCDNRPGVAADIARTREWWDRERGAYDCFISAAVLDELGSEDYPNKEACLRLVGTLPLLEVNAEVLEVARVYLVDDRHLCSRTPAVVCVQGNPAAVFTLHGPKLKQVLWLCLSIGI